MNTKLKLAFASLRSRGALTLNMKTRTPAWTIAMTISATLAMPLPLAAQDSRDRKHEHHHYKVIDIGGLGGPNSFVTYGGITSKSINSRGTVVGNADTSTADPYCLVAPACLLNHAFQWRNGAVTDLGALPGGSNSFAFGINSRDWAVGVSENGAIDPMTGFPEVDAVLWRDGEIINLGTLGGNASGANAVNNRGQVVGGALNTIPAPFPDTFLNAYIFELFPFYFFPLGTESHAFLWQEGKMQDLGTLGGPDSVAWFVNERGQVAGQSSIDSIPNSTTLIPTVDPFFWDHGKMVDVGNLGGTYGYVADLNNRGQMIGTMTLPGDLTYHPFLWNGGVLTDLGTFGGDGGQANAINDAGEVVGWAVTVGNQAVLSFVWRDGVMTSLGTVDGDPCNAADGINSKGQIVGESSPSCFDPNLPAANAFLWENGGPMVDLNTLIPPSSGIELATGASINDRGEIDARAVLPNGDTHAVILIPCDDDHSDVEGCDYSLIEGNAPAAGESQTSGKAALTPDAIRRLVRSTGQRSSPWLGASRYAAVTSGPSATLSPTRLTFATQAIGTTSAAKTVALKNIGTITLTISGIAITGTNAGDFAQTHTCRSSLAAGASCSISVTFKPTASGTRAGALSVKDNAAGSPQQAALSGPGIYGRCLTYGEQCAYVGCCPGLRCGPEGNRFFCR